MASRLPVVSRHIWRCRVFCLLLPFAWGWLSPAAAQEQEAQGPERPVRFLQETPWTVSTPGALHSSNFILAWWDAGAGKYYLDIADFFDRLGFDVAVAEQDSMIEASDPGRIFSVDFSTGRVLQDTMEPLELGDDDFFASEGIYYVSLEGVQAIFTPVAIQFDPTTLHIRLSTAMATLEGSVADRPLPSRGHARGPMLYGRSRALLGNTHINYRLTRSDRSLNSPDYNGGFRVHSNALGGRLAAEGYLSMADGETTTRFRSLNYLLDFPNSPALKRMELGRMSMYEWPLRTTFDGFRLSNIPLSLRDIQREAVIRGIAEPDAVIAASVGGVLADRVRADAQGRYEIRIPAYYGSSQAVLEIVPPGGGAPTTLTRHLFIGEDLLPPGALWYDAQAGRDSFDETLFGFGQLLYGVTQSLSAKASYIRLDSLTTAMVGLTRNQWGFLTASAEVALPMKATRGSLRISLGRMSLQTEAEFSDEPLLSPYKRRLQGQLGVGARRLSLFLNASSVETFAGGDNLNVTGSTTLPLPGKASALFTVGLARSQSPAGSPMASPMDSLMDPDSEPDSPMEPGSDSESVRMNWKGTLTRAASRRGLRGRFGLQADGGVQESLDFAGATLYGYYKKVSVGLRGGYDFARKNPEFAVTLRFDAPWMSVNNHSSVESGSFYHRQSFYGSMELGRPMRFTRQAHMRSSALLRGYYDADRDGRRDPEESLVEDLDIKVFKARVQRVDSTVVRADFLVPSTAYQVVIDPVSLTDPSLHLPTGTTFSFISDPGSTKRVDIPVHRNTIVQGVIEDLPLSSPTQAGVAFFQGDEETMSAEVSQEASFSVLLPPGRYRLEVRDLLGREDLQAFTQEIEVEEGSAQNILVKP